MLGKKRLSLDGQQAVKGTLKRVKKLKRHFGGELEFKDEEGSEWLPDLEEEEAEEEKEEEKVEEVV